MKYLIFMGSPRKSGNTYKLLIPFIEELVLQGAEYELIWLYDMKIEPCIACRTCQKDWTKFGCIHDDDALDMFSKILECDVMVFATPIYSWYCTPPMKALLDRMMYGMNKYYGEEKGPPLWKGKSLALITTCGYPPEKGADLFSEGIKRYCKHSQLVYQGMLAEHDRGYKSTFMNSEKEQHARSFAHRLLNTVCIKSDNEADYRN